MARDPSAGKRTVADNWAEPPTEEHNMWKRDQATKPVNGKPATPDASAVAGPPVAAPFVSQATTPVEPVEPIRRTERNETHMVNIGKSVVIKGDLQGSEDLTIEGQVEGTIELKDHVLTIGPNGRIQAKVFAKTVIILGTVHGNVTASEKVDIRDGASVDGDLVAPRVGIAEGAQFHGSVDMQRGEKRTQPLNAAVTVGTKPALVTPPAERDQARVAVTPTPTPTH
jgi:cytoskeletal protein CcmA (bactofilin family)